MDTKVDRVVQYFELSKTICCLCGQCYAGVIVLSGLAKRHGVGNEIYICKQCWQAIKKRVFMNYPTCRECEHLPDFDNELREIGKEDK